MHFARALSPKLGPLNIALRAWRAGLVVLVLAMAGMAQGQSSSSLNNTTTDNTTVDNTRTYADSPSQLRQPTNEPSLRQDPRAKRDAARTDSTRNVRERERDRRMRWQPSEFELYVNNLAFPSERFEPDSELPIRRLGAELVVSPDRDRDGARDTEAVDFSPLVPPDYIVAPGDEILLTIWGSVDAELRLVVDRSGRITVPRVGAIMVSGVRYADLPATISQRVAQVFRNFQLSVSLGQLRGVRVYVTGFVARPGAYTVIALSSMAAALVKAGGPSASGSFRNVQLRRGSGLVTTLDFYDLLLKGNRSSDLLVQADDVIHVGPIGAQVAFIGSVNRPAIFELKTTETTADALRMAGGFAAVADTSRVSLERVDERATLRVVQVDMSQADQTPLRNGDVLRAFNAVSLASPIQRQNKRVRVEGEVLRPGDYVMPAASTISDALRAAGGLTSGAFVFGTEFSRESVRVTQQENYERALRNLETELALASSTQRITSAEEAAAQAGRSAATMRLVERLKTIRPTGRVVLQLPPDGRELPDLVLEDGDRLFVPPVPTGIGVFGSVFNAGNYLREEGRSLADYLKLAGGPTRGADAGSSFVLRANGTVVSNLQVKTWGTGISNRFEQMPALPGDTLFVPEEIDKTTWVQYAKDWTQILYQFALGVAAFVTLTN